MVEKKSTELKLINDCIYGLIELPQYIVAIIDTPHFQRLRWIYQIGLSYFVYPTATHCRFEHSIGTFHVASKLIRKLKTELDNLSENNSPKITDEDVICIEIAALCHDLGHGPYSHWWDGIFTKKICGKDFHKSHEEISIEILKLLIKENEKVEKILKLWNIQDNEIEFISDLIRGTNENNSNQRRFLFEIVSNKESGLDVDKFDYLARDMVYLGQSVTSYQLDMFRFIHFFKVKKNGNDIWHLTMRDKEFIHVHKLFYLRHILHRIACHNKTTKSIELMLCDAYEEAKLKFEKTQKISNTDESVLKILFKYDNLCDTNLILRLTDQYFWHLIDGNNNNSILKRILTRDLYVLYKVYVKRKCNHKTEELIGNENEIIRNGKILLNDILNDEKWLNIFLENSASSLQKKYSKFGITSKDIKSLRKEIFDHLQKDLEKTINKEKDLIRTSIMEFSLGSDGVNPLFQVYFYKKNRDDIFQFEENTLPNAVTNINENEIEIQIYLINNVELDENISKKIEDWIKTHKFLEQDFI